MDPNGRTRKGRRRKMNSATRACSRFLSLAPFEGSGLSDCLSGTVPLRDAVLAQAPFEGPGLREKAFTGKEHLLADQIRPRSHRGLERHRADVIGVLPGPVVRAGAAVDDRPVLRVVEPKWLRNSNGSMCLPSTMVDVFLECHTLLGPRSSGSLTSGPTSAAHRPHCVLNSDSRQR